MEPFETFDHAGLTVELHYDELCAGPREDYDNGSEMVALPHLWSDYRFADRDATSTETDAVERGKGDAALLVRYLQMKGAEVLPFYFADYGSSGCRIWESEDSISGFFVMGREAIIREYGDTSAESREKARSHMRSELKEMSSYLEGEVYGYVIRHTDKPDSHLDSCWGFIGDVDYLRREATEAAEAVRAHLDAADLKRRQSWAIGRRYARF